MSQRSTSEVGRGVRAPAVAGMFYPANPTECQRAAAEFVTSRPELNAVAGERKWLGGVVPHAGWVCSAAFAGHTIATLAAVGDVDVVVVFGAVHTPAPLERAALDSHATWQTPGQEAELPLEIESRLIEQGGLFTVDERFHHREHAVEVELPLIRAAFPKAAVLPVEVPLFDNAISIGVATARQIIASKQRAVYLASSDLTHYGPDYQFAPVGVGLEGLQWALDNDRRLLELIAGMRTEEIVNEVRTRANACGGGAIAAMMAACRELGAGGGKLLSHANSYQTLANVAPQPPTNAVGYASLVIG
jgi:AmmeMemoRadiSam system protein B